MKLLKLKINGLEIFKETLEIDFFAEQRIYPDNNQMLSQVFENNNTKIYTNNIISFIGINASGKTSILNVITFVLRMLNCESINHICNGILNGTSRVNIESYFYHEEKGVCKLRTVLECEREYIGEEHFFIAEETLWVKSKNKVTSKRTLFEFDKSCIYRERDNQEAFLKDDVSIIMVLNKSNNFFMRDMLGATNTNKLFAVGIFPDDMVRFLDGSIEYLKCDPENKWAKLKFYNQDEISLSNAKELERYLSSGTIKGLNVFVLAQLVFQEGGYLIIDELENHFNQEIVSTLLRFFSNESVNPNGATLIFSTHYSELLDELERNDCINIVRNREGITAEKLSYILKRNDIKKSEAYRSGFLQGTTPVYEAYKGLKSVLLNCVVEEVYREEVQNND